MAARAACVIIDGMSVPGVLPVLSLWQATLDALDANVAVLNGAGRIVAVNRAWRRFARANGGEACLGANYLAVCDAAAGDPVARIVGEALREVLAGRRELFETEYPCHAPAEERWYVMRAISLQDAGPARVMVTHRPA